MIRVRLLTHVTAAGAALASLPLLAGCAAGHDDGATTQTGALAETGVQAGAGTLSFYDYTLQYKSTSGGDEFIRVGERLNTQISFYDAVNLLGDANAAVNQQSDPSQLKLTLQLTYTKFDDSTSTALYPVTFGPGAGGIATGTSADFVVPDKMKSLRADFIAEFADKDGTPQKKQLLAPFGLAKDLVVFGGYAPDKLALFDSLGSQERTRIVEGGDVVAGHNLTLSVTDYRLDTQVDKTSLDQTYGKQKSYSRFGPIEIDAVGNLEYVVSAAISVDGGKTFMPLDLARINDAEVVRGQYGRYAYEKTMTVPPNAASEIQVAFHIQAFLDVPNYQPGTIDNAKYAPGQRVLLKDVWDNDGGANYALPVGQE